MKICGVYKITNTVTNDFYIGSSKDVKEDGQNINAHQDGKDIQIINYIWKC